MEERYCQCCGMPMGETDELYGTEKDGNKSKDYCKYCYDLGEFLMDCTMEEVIEMCIQPMVDENPDMTPEKARSMMMEWFPTLKRWNTVN